MPASLQMHACAFWTTAVALWAIIPVAGLCCRGRRPALPHKWLSYEWLQKACVCVCRGAYNKGLVSRPSIFEVNFAPLWLSQEEEIPHWSHHHRHPLRCRAWSRCQCHPVAPWTPPPRIFYPFSSPTHPFRSPSPPSELLVALAVCLLFPSPPVFANHFFPCQQVNCFVLPFPAFITLCKLSDMSSTGARRSTHRANAKIMRFGIINEDKLAVAVLLSTRARLHYSLNLPEKMT